MSQWPTVPLREVLEERQEQPHDAAILDGRCRIVSKISFDSGTLHFRNDPETKTGMILIKPGDLVVSGINAYKGAVALYEGALDVCATIHYGSYIVRQDRAVPNFIWWLLRSRRFQELLAEHVPGGIKTELKAKRLLPIPIPLPPLPEQRRLVERIDALAAKIGEAKQLRSIISKESDAFLTGFLGRFFNDLCDRHKPVELGDLTTAVVDGPHKTPAYVPEGIPFVTVKNMVTGKLDFSRLQYITPEDHAVFTRRCGPEEGDVLYSKDGATRGCPCYVDTDKAFSIFVSVALIKPRRDLLDGRYLCHLLNSSLIKDRMKDKSRGDMIPHIVLGEIKTFPVPVPQLEEQRRIVGYLDEVQEKVWNMEREQTLASQELDAMLPAILTGHFGGSCKSWPSDS